MTKPDLPFRVLYREFLFRMVDLELLSAHGDVSKLLGQFAGLLLFISLNLAFGGLMFGTIPGPPAIWKAEHMLIALTMLTVGIFAVLSWDSTFPDRRDVLVLAPLPVRASTIFLAKIAALAGSLGLTVASLNALSGFVWPLYFGAPQSGFLGLIRALAVYWATMFAAGAFVLCSVLTLQGLAAQLPRRWFLRLSALLQMGAFCLFLSVVLFQPALSSPAAFAAAGNRHALACLPTYWFLALFQELNGSAPAATQPVVAALAWRALGGLVIAMAGTGTAFLLSYRRTLRKIVEEPDIVPGATASLWTPRFGNLLHTAVVLFSIRTLFRSRQHRMIVAFYLGLGLTLIVGPLESMLKDEQAGSRHLAAMPPNLATPLLLISSVLMMVFCLLGVRVVFAMPLALRSNWIFRVTAIRGPADCLAATRRALLVLAVAPVWLASAAVCLYVLPQREAIEHLLLLGLWGVFLAELGLQGFHKIPFTCSYLPGKSKIHLVILSAVGGLWAVLLGVEYELRSQSDPGMYAVMLAVLAIAAAAARWRAIWLAKAEESILFFEEEEAPTILALGILKDGVAPG
jgi:hypothetical protein